jgi:hypothetical protein
MRRTLLLFLFSLLYLSSSAVEKDTLSFGLSWNKRSKDSFNGEIYLIGRNLLAKSWDTKAGLVVRNYSLNFDGVSNLQSSSIGLNVEQTYLPFKKFLFVGIKFDLSADWLHQISRNKITTERGYKMPLIYYDFTLYLEAGLNIQVTKGLNLRVWVMQGVEDRGLNNNTLSNRLLGNDFISDDSNHYPRQFNIGIDFRL